MCGINGIVRLSRDAAAVDAGVLARTSDALAHRGPDGDGTWVAEDGGAALCHRRLAILDLSPAGAQPMAYDGGRYRLSFNGEIYNYRELKADLERAGVRFVSTSDSEVILALYARERERMLPRLRGMYAFALWDAHERTLLLARDPYGIKPLYVAERDGWIQFASQVRALRAGGRIDDAVDPAGVAGFLLWGSVPEPRTILRGVRSLPAGHYLTVEDGRVREPRPHHDLRRVDPAAAGTTVAASFEESVRDHLVSDVPVAVFLSAGIDSGMLAAIARRIAGETLTTITLRFEDFIGTGDDEGPEAAATARQLGTRHVERVITRAELRDLWPEVLAAMDQPSVDGVNTYVISRAARQAGFKVVLSGLGGDELLGGYDSFRDVPSMVRRAETLQRVPGLSAVWPGLARLVDARRPKLAGALRYGATLPGAYFLRRGLYLPDEIADILGRDAAREAVAAAEPIALAADALGTDARDPFWSVHLLESSLYMRNQLLRDSDWASMAHALELRVPLVDVRLRDALAARGFEPARSGGKAAVARLAAPELPERVLTRTKTGFGIPVGKALGAFEPTLGLGARRRALTVLEAFGVRIDEPVVRAARA